MTAFWDQFTDDLYQPPDNISSEDDLVRRIAADLSDDFNVWDRPQLQGRLCTGRRVRADLVLAPRKQPWGGRNGTSWAPFTLEVKRYSEIGDTTKALAQAADYAHAVWDVQRLRASGGWLEIPDSGRMMSCIMWRDEAYHSSPQARMWLDRIAGRLNVMILHHLPRNGWTLSNSGERQWSQRLGMSNTAFHARPKDGSR